MAKPKQNLKRAKGLKKYSISKITKDKKRKFLKDKPLQFESSHNSLPKNNNLNKAKQPSTTLHTSEEHRSLFKVHKPSKLGVKMKGSSFLFSNPQKKGLARSTLKPRRESNAKLNDHNSSLEDFMQKTQLKQKSFYSIPENVNQENNIQKFKKKQYLNQIQKLINASDILIEVLDARDPNSCRSIEIERNIIGMQKKLILLINKIDLVPTFSVKSWLAHLRLQHPTLVFKAASSSNSRYRSVNSSALDASDELKASSSNVLGASELLQLLKNYARSGTSKFSITVGIFGYPNVGKSSVINSLKGSSSTVRVGGEAGVTRHLQEVQLDSKVTLIDSPGVLFDGDIEDSNSILRNSVKLSTVKDPETVVEVLVKRSSPVTLAKFFNVDLFDNAQTFIANVARSRGKLTKGGTPEFTAASRLILNEWTSGKIRYYCLPPKIYHNEDLKVEFISQLAPTFDISEVYKQDDTILGDHVQQDDFLAISSPIIETCIASQVDNPSLNINNNPSWHFDEPNRKMEDVTAPHSLPVKTKEFIKRKNRRALKNQLEEKDHLALSRQQFIPPVKKNIEMLKMKKNQLQFNEIMNEDTSISVDNIEIAHSENRFHTIALDDYEEE